MIVTVRYRVQEEECVDTFRGVEEYSRVLSKRQLMGSLQVEFRKVDTPGIDYDIRLLIFAI